jgi:hypothetical protein
MADDCPLKLWQQVDAEGIKTQLQLTENETFDYILFLYKTVLLNVLISYR